MSGATPRADVAAASRSAAVSRASPWSPSLLLILFTGSDFSGLLGGGAAGGGSRPRDGSRTARSGPTPTRAMTAGWLRPPSTSISTGRPPIDGYRQPQLIIVDVEAATQCGTASNQTGPFYCPPEETVYVDPTFFPLLRAEFDATAGPLAQLYVLAHEYGHHVQNITGIMQDHPNNGTGADSNSVRTELQADCFAGAWVATPGSRRTRAGAVPAGADRDAGRAMRWMPRRRRRRPHPARVRCTGRTRRRGPTDRASSGSGGSWPGTRMAPEPATLSVCKEMSCESAGAPRRHPLSADRTV